jgi:broad specificity phosphatase PhoE
MNKGKLVTIYIVRHGQVTANVDKIVAGITNSDLTAEGVKQAEDRAKDLAHIEFAAIFSSDLTRAQRTAEIIKQDRKLLVNTTEMLKERNFGIYEGSHEDIYLSENKEAFEKFQTLTEEEKRSFKIHATIETEEEMMSRFITKLRELAVTFPGKNILVVSHGTIMRTFLIHLGYGSRKDFAWGSLDNTAYIKVDSDGIDFFIKEVVGQKKSLKINYP